MANELNPNVCMRTNRPLDVRPSIRNPTDEELKRDIAGMAKRAVITNKAFPLIPARVPCDLIGQSKSGQPVPEDYQRFEIKSEGRYKSWIAFRSIDGSVYLLAKPKGTSGSDGFEQAPAQQSASASTRPDWFYLGRLNY